MNAFAIQWHIVSEWQCYFGAVVKVQSSIKMKCLAGLVFWARDALNWLVLWQTVANFESHSAQGQYP